MKRKLPEQEKKEYREKLDTLKSKTKAKQKKAKGSRTTEADDSDVDPDMQEVLDLQEEEQRGDVKRKKLKKKAMVTKAERQRQKEYVLALADQPEKKRISKTNGKKLKSIVGDSAETIQQMLELNEGDGARSLIYKKMLQSLVDLIPYAENNIRKTKGSRGVYQLNSMISSIRELLIDVQASEDRGRIGDLLVERLVAPTMLEIGTDIVQKLDLIKSDAKDRMDSSDYKRFVSDVNNHRNSLADMINSKFYELKDQIQQHMQR